MRTKLLLSLLAALGLASCTDTDSTTSTSGQYLNALTGEVCNLDRVTYMPRLQASPIVAVDCIGKHIEQHVEGVDGPCCEFPQPGCDGDACCDGEVVIPPEPEGPPVF